MTNDPTRTATQRRKFMQSLRGRLNKLRYRVRYLIEVEDAFGLRMVRNASFRFSTSSAQLKQFELWLKSQMDELLTPDNDDAYWKAFVQEGYMKGAGRAFTDVNKTLPQENLSFFQGSREEFLQSAFGQPVAIEKIKLLASRTLNDLKGVTDEMSTRMVRVLAEGLSQGAHPRTIAKNLIDVTGFAKSRLETIARTEIIRAHAEGQLDALERMGIEEVGVQPEWSTAGDERVCPLCRPLEGIIVKTKDAHGMIPRHPNCRCAFIPADEDYKRPGQIRSKAAIEKAVKLSLKRQKSKKGSSWAAGQALVK